MMWCQHLNVANRQCCADPPQPEAQEGALLSATYLADLLDNVKTEGQEYVPEAFQPKFINIMDPMCPTNNLGRSVSKANAARIRKAWAHAAQSLGDIVQQVPKVFMFAPHWERNCHFAVTDFEKQTLLHQVTAEQLVRG